MGCIFLKKNEEKFKYWTPKKILAQKATYNVVYGERSNGKTTGVLGYFLKQFVESNYTESCALIRRWHEDFKGHLGQQMVDGLNSLGWVKEFTKGEYTTIYYYSSKWYLVAYSEDGKISKKCEQPFMYGFSLASDEHYKGSSYPSIKNVLFDEFITRKYYLPDEFVKFQNVLSTIIRLRSDVIIFMCANTVNKYCPYFDEMGLVHVKEQQKDTIEIYTYANNKLKVAVEYTFSGGKNKPSNFYFAFDNPKLKMITEGEWELDIYPHLPYKYTDREVICKFFIIFDNEKLQCNIIQNTKDKSTFIFIHRKTTDIKDIDKDIVYSKEHNYRTNWYRKITRPTDIVSKTIYNLFFKEKIFYQDNTVGETVRNYIIWCKKDGQ